MTGEPQEAVEARADRGLGRGPAAAVVLLALVLLLVAGGTYYRSEVASAREDARSELQSVAALKMGRLVAWMDERRADAAMMSMPGNPLFETAIRPLLANPADATARARVAQPLERIRGLRGYEAALLVTPGGDVLLGTGVAPDALEPSARQLVRRALEMPDPVVGDLIATPTPNDAILDMATAYRDEHGQPVAVLLLRTAARRDLFPLVQLWPTPSATAETMLVRREGDEVVFLNPLRHVQAQPMSVRRPIDADLVASRAARGQAGLVQAGDYRNVPVVADLRPVPATAWYMVTKVDVDEIFAQARRRGLAVLAMTATAALALVTAALALRAMRRRNAWRTRFQQEREQRLALEEYRATLQSIGDGVLSTDAQGRVRGLNAVAETLTGWTDDQARGRPVREVFHIVHEDTRAEVESPVDRVLSEGRVVGLANHTLLVARDGTERPIADSGAPVRRDDGVLEGVVLVFRDQSAERQAYNALRASETRFRRLFEGTADALLLLDMDRQRFIDCNFATVAMLGLDSRDEVLQTHPAELSPPQQADGRESQEKAGDMIETARREGFHRFEWLHSSRARAPFPVDVILTPIDIDGQHLAITSWRDLTEAKRAERENARVAQEALERSHELERFNRAAVDRELRMRELKREVDALCERLGERPRYGYGPAAADDRS